MTTKRSPLSALKKQADTIAAHLKAAERGEPIPVTFAHKIEEARKREVLKLGVVMDDKLLTIEMPWETIGKTSETALSAWILRQMRESRETTH